jgi:RNA-directed DNA polymerase
MSNQLWTVQGKANRRNPCARVNGESDGDIVSKKLANKGEQPPAESMERREPTKRNSQKQATDRVQDRRNVSNELERVRQRAKANRKEVFVNLFSLLKVPLLREAFYALKRKASAGLDGVGWYEYERQLEARLPQLQDELHKGSYRATPAKRTYVEKPDGRKRPLGVQAVEDKVVQMACVMILNEVYEPLFCGFSYGSRPGRGAHDALDALHEGICRKRINWILDCDIEGFFDHLPHDKLMEIIGKRVSDPRMLRLLRKWLRVGWVEEGKRHPATVGTPQGSVISPLLANIFLNEAMDLWAAAWRRCKNGGDVILVRYVDDAVFGFQSESQAQAFLQELRERLSEYAMNLHPGKTRLIEFGRWAASNRKKRDERRPETFDFLGFTHACATTRNGKFKLRRVTIAKRMTRKLAEIKEELRKRMHEPLGQTGRWLGSVMRGVVRYFAVPGNLKSMRAFYTAIGRMWMRSIRRRSQKARTRWTWERFYRLQAHWLPRPRLSHPYPSQRFDAKYSR